MSIALPLTRALRDGGILVVLIVFLFLFNFRAASITIVAMPLSLLAAVLAMKLTGATINSMTLGGMAIAVGAIVDDAIIDVENVFRRLRENALRPEPERRSVLDVVYRGSSEIRKSIVFATLVIGLVFIPLFFLDGVEGYFREPYANNAEFVGYPLTTQEHLEMIVDQAGDLNWPVGVHVVGDAAMDMALNAFERSRERRPLANHRHMLEHAFLPSERDFDRTGTMGVGVTLQHALVYALGGNMSTYWGAERAADCTPARAWLRCKIPNLPTFS